MDPSDFSQAWKGSSWYAWSDDDFMSAVEGVLDCQDKNFKTVGYNSFNIDCQKCIDVEGDYVEK